MPEKFTGVQTANPEFRGVGAIQIDSSGNILSFEVVVVTDIVDATGAVLIHEQVRKVDVWPELSAQQQLALQTVYSGILTMLNKRFS